jgi:uncharacterized protein (TIGR01777 family)
LHFVITGASGLIGSALVPYLEARGHRVTKLIRRSPLAGESAVLWNPERGELDARPLEGCDVVIHLAGENIAGARWTVRQKQRLLDSRVQGTRLLAMALSTLKAPPKVFLTASAVGFYGDRGEELLTEQSSPGQGFLCDLVRQWEAASYSALERGIRVTTVRLGIVLSSAGGALKEMALPFRFGVGGPLGTGRQYMTWITREDVLNAILFIVDNNDLIGPVNVASPQPLRQQEFAVTMGRVLHKPAWFSVPRWVIAMRLGRELAESILASQRMVPEKLLKAGFCWSDPELEPALRRLLK